MKVTKTVTSLGKKYEIANFAGFFVILIDGKRDGVLYPSFKEAEAEMFAMMRKCLGI